MTSPWRGSRWRRPGVSATPPPAARTKTPADDRLIEVALPVPANDGVFTYRLPEGLVAEPGRRVAVPLGARTATGVVLGDASVAPGAVRDVLRVLDEGPLLPDDVVKLCRFAAAHYLSPLGLAIRAALPPGGGLKEE